MKIAIDCRMSGKSGIGTFLDGILPYLLDTPHTFVLLGFTPQDSLFLKEKLERTNVELFPLQAGVFSVKETFFFPKSARKKINSCDLFFSPYCNIPSGIRVPVFTTIHDIVFLDVAGLSGKIGTLARKWFYVRAVRKSRCIFTVSEFSKQRITEKLFCPKEKISVVYSALPAFFEKPLVPPPAKKNAIIFVGNIKKHKGLSILLEAFDLLKKNWNKALGALPSLVIVGSKENFRTHDTEMEAALSLAKDLDALERGDSCLIFTGYVSNETLHTLLSTARLLVQPSLYEGFGVPPMEALSCGTRALISDIPVFKEIYKNLPVDFFKTGSALSLEEKILELWPLTKEPLPPVPISNFYSFEKTSKKILDVLQNVI